MEILLSNDDGVSSLGLHAHADILAKIGNIHVVAPDANCSGFSHALTLEKPLRPITLKNGFVALNGTPADCVHIALNGLLGFTPDLVVSGINIGANLGDDVLYSGTVAAAMEGRFLATPSLAVSMVDKQAEDFQPAAKITRLLVEALPTFKLPSHTVLNVNIPPVAPEKMKGIAVTRLGHRGPAKDVVKIKDPRGQTHYWIGAAGEELDAGPGTDFHAIREGYISITPLKADMSYYEEFDKLADWVAGINQINSDLN